VFLWGLALVSSALWIRCLGELENELDEQLFNTWILPLQAIEDNGVLRLLAPNRYVVDWINQNYLDRITGAVRNVGGIRAPIVLLEVGSVEAVAPRVAAPPARDQPADRM
jgi:chromosomal replication initiator protein